MACKVPLDIVRQQTDKCELKCKLWYNYGNSSCLLTNKKDRISIVYDGQSDIMFNSVPYKPTEIQIFKPSIHMYDGENADAELIILHTGGQNGLQICIPITMSQQMTTNTGSQILEELIENAPTTSGAITVNIPDFNANYLIPKCAYFSYAGGKINGNSITGFTCSESAAQVQYVVVHQRHGSITLKKETLDTLGTLITDHFMPYYTGKSFYNEIGTTQNGFSGDGQIYIDCQPTDADSELVYDSPITHEKWDWLWPYFLMIVGVLFAIVAFYVFSPVKHANTISNNLDELYAKASKCTKSDPE